MNRYRIGFDMTVLWAVHERDGVTPYNLTDKEVRLFMTHNRGREEVEVVKTHLPNGSVNNVVQWFWPAYRQRVLGPYTLTLEILTSAGKRTIRKDVCEAFEMVGRDCMASDDEDEANINEGGVITLASSLDIYRISPIVPEIGENGNWIVDGEDTGQPARGERGEVAEIAYVYFDVDGSMDLNCSIVAGDSSLERGFGLSDDGYLTLDGTVDGVTGNSPSTSVASFENLLEVSAWEYDGNGTWYFPENQFEKATSGNCSLMYKGVIFYCQGIQERRMIFTSAYIPNKEITNKNVVSIAIDLDTREVTEGTKFFPPLEEAPLAENLDENTSFLLATEEGVRTIPVMGLLGELVNIISDLQNRVSELEQKIN